MVEVLDQLRTCTAGEVSFVVLAQSNDHANCQRTFGVPIDDMR